MAREWKVKQYLACWLQLGKKVWLRNGAIARVSQETIAGESYSGEFEQMWEEVRSGESGDCYLEGTSETVGELMNPDWEIVSCARCTMPKPVKTSGMPCLSCPCEDLANWPNAEIPAPRSPVNNRDKLEAIRDRLDQMARRADLYASTIVAERSDSPQSSQEVAWLRHHSELILNSAGEGICGLDRQMNVSFLNPAAATMLGYQSNEAIGDSIQIVLSGPLSDGIPCQSPECPIYATLTEGKVQYGADRPFWRKDGTTFPVEYISAPIRERGEIVGAVLTFKDITERHEIERMKDEFISVVSHELRTPLTAIRGALGLLAGGVLANQPEKSQRMLHIAVENTDRLLRLLNDILDMERMTSGKTTPAKQRCNAAELMRQTADAMQATIEKAAIAIGVEPVEVPVWADPDRLIQIFINLLSNAIKFSPPGSTVWLTASVQEGEVLFQVRDRGRGIPSDKLETIFERFQQVDSSDSRAHGGTGLGLAICQKIVQQHGGRIWVESQLGEGSTFFFTIPMPPIAEPK